MKIEFLGMYQEKSGGCPVCGKSKVSNVAFHRDKRIFLPTGRSIYFVVGKPEEVNELEAGFLLEQTYTSNGGTKIMFREVK